jgi:hypothetical protein
VYVSDPVGAGAVASLARPGKNTTGLLLYDLPYFRNHIPIAAESQEIHPDCLPATGLRPNLN